MTYDTHRTPSDMLDIYVNPFSPIQDVRNFEFGIHEFFPIADLWDAHLADTTDDLMPSVPVEQQDPATLIKALKWERLNNILDHALCTIPATDKTFTGAVQSDFPKDAVLAEFVTAVKDENLVNSLERDVMLKRLARNHLSGALNEHGTNLVGLVSADPALGVEFTHTSLPNVVLEDARPFLQTHNDATLSDFLSTQRETTQAIVATLDQSDLLKIFAEQKQMNDLFQMLKTMGPPKFGCHE